VQAHAQQLSAEHEAAPRWNKLTGKKATVVAQPHEPSWHEPVLKAKRILLVDFAATQARTKGAAPSANREGAPTEAATAKPPNASPPPTANGVDRLYRQLMEIHAMTTVQLVECTYWCQFDPTSSPVHAGASRQRPIMEPSVAGMAPPPLTYFSPQAPQWQWGQRVEPQAHQQAHQGDVGAQPECHAWNPCPGKHRDRMGHHPDPKWPRVKAS
jgi:hypothetical protein